jgi:hypothetical protein
MAEDAFGESGTDYNRREANAACVNSTIDNAQELNQRLVAHMLELEAPGVVDPITSYYLLHSRPPFVAGDSTQLLSYPASAGFTMNPVMSGDGAGSVGGNWSQNMAAPDNYGINNTNYMYGFGEYGV